VERFGGVDVLINNAGLVHRSAFRDTDVDVFRRVMEVNYFGSLNVTKAMLDSLVARRGLIIVVSSIAGLSPLYGRSGYSASKHALHGLFESLRSELEGSGVEVLMVCPSFTRTAFEQRALDARGGRVRRGRSKLGSEATPEFVAESVYRAALRHRRLLVLSPVGKLSIWLSHLAPGLHTRLMARTLRDELGSDGSP
jgi:short-subunit dehydrogenase